MTLYAVKNPDGEILWLTIAVREQCAKEFGELKYNEIWPSLETKGYTVVPVQVTEILPDSHIKSYVDCTGCCHYNKPSIRTCVDCNGTNWEAE